MRLTDPSALFSNVALPTAMAHVLAGALLTGGLFVAACPRCTCGGAGAPGTPTGRSTSGCSGRRSASAWSSPPSPAPLTVVFGGLQFTYLDRIQPTKFAADGPAPRRWSRTGRRGSGRGTGCPTRAPSSRPPR